MNHEPPCSPLLPLNLPGASPVATVAAPSTQSPATPGVCHRRSLPGHQPCEVTRFLTICKRIAATVGPGPTQPGSSRRTRPFPFAGVVGDSSDPILSVRCNFLPRVLPEVLSGPYLSGMTYKVVALAIFPPPKLSATSPQPSPSRSATPRRDPHGRTNLHPERFKAFPPKP